MKAKVFLFVLGLFLLGSGLSLADHQPPRSDRPRGQPQNAWRYQFYNGRWWFWTHDDRWSYYDGRQWITLRRSTGRIPAGGRTKAESVRGPVGGSTYSAFGAIPYGSSASRVPSLVGGSDAATLLSPLFGSGSPSGLGAQTTIGLTPESSFGGTRARSGDAGSGVGGGAVGGTTVTGGPGTGPAR